MQPFGAMAAAFLLTCAVPLPSQADGPPGPATAMARPAAPDCKCPQVRQRPHRHVRHHARHPRQRPPVAVAAAPLPYDPPIPSPWNTAYDRAMVLHFRSPAVSGSYRFEPGYPPTPPVVGIQHYRVPTGPAVFQYDGVTGQYIQLAQRDARRAFPAGPQPQPR